MIHNEQNNKSFMSIHSIINLIYGRYELILQNTSVCLFLRKEILRESGKCTE